MPVGFPTIGLMFGSQNHHQTTIVAGIRDYMEDHALAWQIVSPGQGRRAKAKQPDADRLHFDGIISNNQREGQTTLS